MNEDAKNNQNPTNAEPQQAPTELEKVTKERDEYLAGWQRAKADFANYKKRADEDMKSFRTMANEGLVEELIPVLQSFEMAFANKEAWEKADKNWRAGVEYIHSQLKSVLDQHGLKEVDPVGQTFDPQVHEAVRYETTADEDVKPGTIVSVTEKGYMFGTKLMKPAKVVVSEALEKK